MYSRQPWDKATNMKVDIQEKGVNERQIELTVESSDFAPKLNERLKKLRNQTNIKGFRHGKTPMSFIKRQYGKQIAAEVISDATTKLLSQIIDENAFDLINEPLMTDSHVPALEDGGLDEDCTFTYILGLMPQLELNGISTEDSYIYYELEVEDSKIDERLDAMRLQMGDHTHPENIEDKDVVEIEAHELEGDSIKENGSQSTFRFAVDLVADEKLKKELLGLKKDDEFVFDIYNLELDRDETYVKKYFLKLEDDADATSINNMFEGKIASIHRQEKAELNEAFFEKAFPEHIKSESAAREEIGKQYIKGYSPVGDNLFIKEIVDKLENKNEFELPENYVHQLLHSSGKAHHDDEALDDFKKSIRRQILISMIIKKLGIEISQDDMRKKVMEEFTANFGGMTLPPETIDRIVENAMKDEKYVRELSDKVLNDKLISTVKTEVSLDIVKKPEEELMKLYDETFPRKSEEEE